MQRQSIQLWEHSAISFALNLSRALLSFLAKGHYNIYIYTRCLPICKSRPKHGNISSVCRLSYLIKRQYLQGLPFEFLGQTTVFTMFAIRVSWPKDSIYSVCHSSFLAKRQYLQCLPFEFLGQKTIYNVCHWSYLAKRQCLQCLPYYYYYYLFIFGLKQQQQKTVLVLCVPTEIIVQKTVQSQCLPFEFLG